MELNPMQRAAVITAMGKALKKEGDKARHEADDALMELYEATGTDRVRVKLGEADVGTFTIAFEGDSYEVLDRDALEDFCLANGLAEETRSIRPEWMGKAVEEMATHYPEAIETRVEINKDLQVFLKRVDDATYVIEGTTETVPGIRPRPRAIKGTQLRGCKPEDVIPSLKGLGVGVEQLLLGGAE